MQQILLPTGPLFYRCMGDGPPLLLLHGWGGSSCDWEATMARLAPQRRIYAPDLPGFGRTPPLEGAVGGQRLAEVVRAFADALGLEHFDLNGHSFSAGVALYLAAAQPARVRRLVLTCFSTFRNERERYIVDQLHHVMLFWMMLRRPWMARVGPFYRTIARRFYYRLPPDATLRRSMADFMLMDRRTAVESAASAGSPAIHTAMRAIVAPTLLIGARHDKIMPTGGTPHITTLIPDCRLVWIERCGHLPMIERPVLYNRLIETFFTTP